MLEHFKMKESVITDKNRKIPAHLLRPHCTRDHRREKVVFGKEEEGLAWLYSDRASQEGDTKKAASVANEKAPKDTALWYEEYLSALFGKPVTLHCIVSGCNSGNGWDYRVYGYRKAEV